MARLHELGGLLLDAVGNGASVGFTLPLKRGEVAGYWQKVCAEVAAKHRLLFAALDDTGRIIGSARSWRSNRGPTAGIAPRCRR